MEALCIVTPRYWVEAEKKETKRALDDFHSHLNVIIEQFAVGKPDDNQDWVAGPLGDDGWYTCKGILHFR